MTGKSKNDEIKESKLKKFNEFVFTPIHNLFNSQMNKYDLFTDIMFITLCFSCEDYKIYGKISLLIIIIN